MPSFAEVKQLYPGWDDARIIDAIAKDNNTSPEYVAGYLGYTPPSFTGELKTAVPRSLGQTAQGIGQVLKDVGWAENPIKRYGDDVVARNPSRINSMGDIAEHPAAAFGSAVGNAAGFLATGGGLGLAGKAAGAYGLARTGAAIGGGLGQTVNAALPSYAGIREQQGREGNNAPIDMLTAGAGAGAVGWVEQRFGLNKMLGISSAPKMAMKEAVGGAGATPLGQAARAWVRTGLEEGAEELVQNPIEQVSAYQDPTTSKNLEDTAASGVMGAMGGLGLGVYGGARAGVRRAQWQREVAAQESIAANPELPATDRLQALDFLQKVRALDVSEGQAAEWRQQAGGQLDQQLEDRRAEIVEQMAAEQRGRDLAAGNQVSLLTGVATASPVSVPDINQPSVATQAPPVGTVPQQGSALTRGVAVPNNVSVPDVNAPSVATGDPNAPVAAVPATPDAVAPGAAPAADEAAQAPAVGATDIAAAPAPVAPQLTPSLRKSKPRYGGSTLAFADDVHHAAYMIGKEKKAVRDAEYLSFVKKALGVGAKEARAYGRSVVAAVQGVPSVDGRITVPSVPFNQGVRNGNDGQVVRTGSATGQEGQAVPGVQGTDVGGDAQAAQGAGVQAGEGEVTAPDPKPLDEARIPKNPNAPKVPGRKPLDAAGVAFVANAIDQGNRKAPHGAYELLHQALKRWDSAMNRFGTAKGSVQQERWNNELLRAQHGEAGSIDAVIPLLQTIEDEFGTDSVNKVIAAIKTAHERPGVTEASSHVRLAAAWRAYRDGSLGRGTTREIRDNYAGQKLDRELIAQGVAVDTPMGAKIAEKGVVKFLEGASWQGFGRDVHAISKALHHIFSSGRVPTPTVVFSKTAHPKGDYITGRYESATHTVTIFPSGNNKLTLLHELLHAATTQFVIDYPQHAAVDALRNTLATFSKRHDTAYAEFTRKLDPALVGQLDVAVRNVIDGFKNAKTADDKQDALLEFVAYGMTNQTFQEYMKSMGLEAISGKVVAAQVPAKGRENFPPAKNARLSVWGKFVNALSWIINGTPWNQANATVMNQFLSDTTRLLEAIAPEAALTTVPVTTPPSTVYHQSDKAVSKFEARGKPIWFSEDPKYDSPYGTEAVTTKAALSLKNPLDFSEYSADGRTQVSDGKDISPDGAAAWLKSKGVIAPPVKYFEGIHSVMDVNPAAFVTAGYDGFRMVEDRGQVTWGVFDPKNVAVEKAASAGKTPAPPTKPTAAVAKPAAAAPAPVDKGPEELKVGDRVEFQGRPGVVTRTVRGFGYGVRMDDETLPLKEERATRENLQFVSRGKTLNAERPTTSRAAGSSADRGDARDVSSVRGATSQSRGDNIGREERAGASRPAAVTTGKTLYAQAPALPAPGQTVDPTTLPFDEKWISKPSWMKPVFDSFGYDSLVRAGGKKLEALAETFAKDFPGAAQWVSHIDWAFGLNRDMVTAWKRVGGERQYPGIAGNDMAHAIRNSPPETQKAVWDYLDGKPTNITPEDQALADQFVEAFDKLIDDYLEHARFGDEVRNPDGTVSSAKRDALATKIETAKFSDLLIYIHDADKTMGSSMSTAHIADYLGTRKLQIPEEHVIGLAGGMNHRFFLRTEMKMGTVQTAGFVRDDLVDQYKKAPPPGEQLDETAGWFHQGTDPQTKEIIFSRNTNYTDAAKAATAATHAAAIENTVAHLSRVVTSAKYAEATAQFGATAGQVYDSRVALEKDYPHMKGYPIPTRGEASRATYTKEKHLRRSDQWVQIPADSTQYGDLSGKIVNGAVMAALDDVYHTRPAIPLPAYNTALRWFKINKTVLSPGTHMINVGSNVSWMYLHDIPTAALADGTKILFKAELRPGTLTPREKELWMAFRKSGGLVGNYSVAELRAVLTENDIDTLWKKPSALAGLAGSMLDYERLKASKIGEMAKDTKKWAGKSMDFLQGLYAAEDNAFRFAAFLSHVATLEHQQGHALSDTQMLDAGIAATEKFLDYSIHARGINLLKQTLIPFISWPYRAIPAMLKLAVHKPWKVGSMLAVYALLDSLTVAASGGDDEDKKKRKVLPAYMNERLFKFGPRMYMEMPGLGTSDRPTYFKVGGFIPLGDMIQDDSRNGFMGLKWFPSAFTPNGPMVSALIGTVGGVDPFTGQKIDRDTDSQWEAFNKRAAFLEGQIAPPALDARKVGEKWDRIVNDKTGPLGHEYSDTLELAQWVGLRFTQIDMAESAATQRRAVSAIDMEYKKELARVTREAARFPNRNPQDLVETRAAIKERMQKEIDRVRNTGEE